MKMEDIVKDAKFEKMVNSAKAFKHALPNLAEESIVKMAISYCIEERRGGGFKGGFQKKEVKVEADPGSYVISFGKHKGKTLASCELDDIKGYVDYFIKKNAEEGKPMGHALKELKANLDAFVNAPNRAEVLADDIPF